MHIGKCERCGKEREYKYKSHVKRFCSHACSNIAKWDTRDRGVYVDKTCQQCGTVFALLESHLRVREKDGVVVKFCSQKCSNSAKVIQLASCRCIVCNKDFLKKPRLIKQKSLCSVACAHELMRIENAQKVKEPKIIDKELIAKQRKEYRTRNAEKLRQQRKEKLLNRTDEQRQKTLDYLRNYAKLNKDRHIERARAWTEKNKAKKLAIQAKYRESNRDKICVHSNLRRSVISGGDLTAAQWAEIKEIHDNKCAHCGVSEKLTLDHIIPLSSGGTHTKSNVQPLCKSCNSRKGNRPDKFLSSVENKKLPAYILKRKLMLHVHGIKVRQVAKKQKQWVEL